MLNTWGDSPVSFSSAWLSGLQQTNSRSRRHYFSPPSPLAKSNIANTIETNWLFINIVTRCFFFFGTLTRTYKRCACSWELTCRSRWFNVAFWQKSKAFFTRFSYSKVLKAETFPWRHALVPRDIILRSNFEKDTRGKMTTVSRNNFEASKQLQEYVSEEVFNFTTSKTIIDLKYRRTGNSPSSSWREFVSNHAKL